MDNSKLSIQKHQALVAEQAYKSGRSASLPDIRKQYFLESIALSLIVANNLAISREEKELHEES